MWGIHAATVLCAGVHRLIPTHVGNTHPPPAALRRDAVHPHACGEYETLPISLSSATGSSPRVWGIRFRPGPRPDAPRFIPTRVGNTLRPERGQRHGSVHPHACGEYCPYRAALRTGAGSSPRVWGIQLKAGYRIYRKRFIPTRVGNTKNLCNRCVKTAVHPHACGEYNKAPVPSWSGGGSSPRVWGILPGGSAERAHPRFIPTRVGNTLSMRIENCPASVHPHACGEYLSWMWKSKPTAGSSPRVWGILFRKMQEITDC